MASPVAHSLLGLTLGLGALLPPCRSWRALAQAIWQQRGPLFVCIFWANLPDLDYVPGLLIGDLNAYHHGLTHTIAWAAATAVGAWMLAWAWQPRLRFRWLLLLFLLGFTHLVLDCLTVDRRPPIGIRLWWPFSDAYVHGPLILFHAMRKHTLAAVWQWHNFRVLLREVYLLLPWLGLVLLYKRYGARRLHPRLLLGALLLGSLGCGRPPRPDWIELPGGAVTVGSPAGRRFEQPREIRVAPFAIARHEVTVRDWVAFLNATQPAKVYTSPQVRRRRGRYQPLRGTRRQPAAWITPAQAEAYCAWVGARTGRAARLPTEAEWEYAARGGLRQAPYPWGWGDPAGRAAFRAAGLGAVGRYAPNPFGLRDMAGGVFEWCAEAPDLPAGQRAARGGAWSERDPFLLRNHRRTFFPDDYRDADVGLRLAAEPASATDPAARFKPARPARHRK